MTRLLYIFIVSLLTNSCFGQPDTTSKNRIFFGANAGLLINISSKILNNPNSFEKEEELPNFFAVATIEKGRSLFAAGPILSPHLIKEHEFDRIKGYGNYELNGFHLLYQFNLRHRAKKFNSFFQAQFLYFHYINTGEDEKLFPMGGYGNVKYTSDWTAKGYFISYGLNIKSGKNLYISSNVGIGGVIDREFVTYDQNGSFWNNDHWNARTSITMGLSLGYKFR